MKCSERHEVAIVHHMGDRIALDGAQNESTTFDAIPMNGANTIRVAAKFLTQSAFAIVELLALGGNDGANWTTIGGTNLVNPPVDSTFEVTGIPFRLVRLAVKAQGAGKGILALQAYTYSK